MRLFWGPFWGLISRAFLGTRKSWKRRRWVASQTFDLFFVSWKAWGFEKLLGYSGFYRDYGGFKGIMVVL